MYTFYALFIIVIHVGLLNICSILYVKVTVFRLNYFLVTYSLFLNGKM